MEHLWSRAGDSHQETSTNA